MKKILCLVLVAPLLFSHSVLGHDGEDHDENPAKENLGPPQILGELDFLNSGAVEAQDAFTRGVLLLHSFEFSDARTAFQEAQTIDPGFVMAIWGEAMTLNHPLWAQQDREEALKVLDKLPPLEQRRISAREQALLDAVLILYGYGEQQPASKPQRDHAYMDAMQQAHEQHPEDLEAATFYGLSILGSVYQRDFRTYMRAAAVLEEVFAKQPRHPGAAHYLIHSYDDQVHAPLGLRAARVYATIAPAASHAQHMISHIYTSLGMWDEVVTANITAVEVSEAAMLRAGKPAANRSKHAMHWLQYAYLQQGRYDKALETMAVMKADRDELNNLYQNTHYVLFRGSYVADDPAGRQQLAAIELPAMSADFLSIDDFATGYAMLANGQLDQAVEIHARMRERLANTPILSVEEGLHEDDTATSEDAHLIASILVRELGGLILYRQGRDKPAIDELQKAAGDENGRPLEYGPPYVPKPTSELLGEILLAEGRPQEAAAEFYKSLERNTNRALSLLGLARAYEAMGEAQSAAETWALLKDQWRGDLALLEESANRAIAR